MKKSFLILSFGTGIISAQTSTFITDGDWLEAANWDTGAVVPDNQTAFINANAIVDRIPGPLTMITHLGLRSGRDLAPLGVLP